MVSERLAPSGTSVTPLPALSRARRPPTHGRGRATAARRSRRAPPARTAWRRRRCAPSGRRGPRRPAAPRPARPGRAPPASSSSGSTLSWQFPNRSTHHTSATIAPSSCTSGSDTRPGTSPAGSTGRRGRRAGTPAARCAGRGREDVAPGERGAGRGEVVVGIVSATTRRAPPTIATAGASRPLSGPRSTPPSTSTATQPAIRADARVDDGDDDGVRQAGTAPRARAGAPRRERRGPGCRGRGR